MTDFENAIRMLNERAKHAAAIQKDIQEVRGIAETEDGHVTVEVGATGQLESVRLDPRAMRMASEDLAEAIVTLSKEAMEDASSKTQQLLQPLIGPDADIQDVLNGEGSMDSEFMQELGRSLGVDIDPETLRLPDSQR